MSTMVMCPDQPPASGMFQRYPSPPVNYPPFNVYSGFNAPGGQHPQDYNQFQVGDHGVQHAWYNSMYGSRTEDWSYGAPAVSMPMTSTPAAMGTYSYRSGQMGIDYSQPTGQVTSDSPGDTSSSSSSSGSPSNKQLRPPYDWMKKATYQSAPTSGKTRTKDKYRVVYSDHQRLELEKEFHYSRYITIRRKAELAQTLGLSERQVKIWFQNRRAKERKQNKKREENQLLKIASELGDLDDKQLVQPHMNMQMNTHAQQHQIQVTSPSPKPIHQQNPYSYPQHQQTGPVNHMQSPEVTLSPQNHMAHSQYSSPNHLAIPISPGNDAIGTPASGSMSPVTIKTDVDASDNMNS